MLTDGKPCSVCRIVKPLSDFFRRKAMRDGRRSECKKCCSADKKHRYKTNAGYSRRVNSKQKEYCLSERRKLIEVYGGKCACCGERHFEFMTVDHINGRGPNHSRQKSGMSGRKLVMFLKRNGYPHDNYQLLCYNCNCAKGTSGFCPHALTRHLVAV